MATGNSTPLLSHSYDTDEAVTSVRNVLSFMSMAFREGIDVGGSKAAADGAGLILETCADTLAFHFGKKGGVI